MLETISPEKQRFNQVCNSLRHLGWYTKEGNNVYKIHSMKNYWSAMRALKHVNRKMVVGDFGCLDGSMAYHLSKLAKAAYGFDLPQVIEKMMYTQEDNLHYVGIDLDVAFPVPREGRFDMILAMDILEHLNRDILFLMRCMEYLSPGGLIIIATPLSPVEGQVSQDSGRQSHFREYTKWQLSVLLAEIRIDILEHYTEVEEGQTIETTHILGRKG